MKLEDERKLPLRELIKKHGVIVALDIKYPFLWMDLETYAPIISLVSLLISLIALKIVTKS